MQLGRLIRQVVPPVLLAVIALVAWRAASQADFDPIATAPEVYEQKLATPMLSARRLPETLRAPISDDLIAADVNAVQTNSPSPQTCVIVRNGDRVLGTQADVTGGLIPASNQKVLTTWVALRHPKLGPDFRFQTGVRADALPVAGTVEGNLYLTGDGDPFLYTEDWISQYDEVSGRAHTRLEDLADQVVAAGVTAVSGQVIGDESLYDAVRYGPWDRRLITQKQSGPLSALSVNEGFTSWDSVYPGTARNRSVADDPPLHSASVFTRLLQDRGVEVGGSAAGPTPTDAEPLAQITSPPLIELVTHINSYSSNFGAEMLLKRIGLEQSGQASTEQGAAVVRTFLEEQGIPMGDLVIRDGSGLSEDNRLTCAALAAIVVAENPDSLLGKSLSISGQRGSLENRFVDTRAETRVRAKTGSLDKVNALTGYVLADDPANPGRFVSFAIIINSDQRLSREQIAADVYQPFVIAMTGYPSGPSISLLSPQPAQSAG